MRHRLLALLFVSFSSIGLLAESAAGVTWTAPAGWTIQAQRPMRAATYTMAAAQGDKGQSECVVYFFGAGQGGSVEANIERWKGQFTGPNKSPAAAKVANRTVHSLRVTTIDTSGDYSGLGGPVTTGTGTVAGYRLLGAIVEGPGGNLFVKFTGPAKTVAANEQKFEQFLASFQAARGR